MEYAARCPDELARIICFGSSAAYRGWLGIRTQLTSALCRFSGRLPFVEQWFLNRTVTQIRDLPISEATVALIINGGFHLYSWGKAGSFLVGYDFHERPRQFEGSFS